MEHGEPRAAVWPSSLETGVPRPLHSDQYVTLRGPGHAPVLWQAMRWKTPALGWPTGLGWSAGECDWGPREPWYRLPPTSAHRRWQRAHERGEREPLTPACAQRLREVACWDPTIPAVGLGPRSRWGAFRWRERPVPGKEFAVTRSQSLGAPGGSSGYVPLLSFCCTRLTAQDTSTWNLPHHQFSSFQ